MHTGLLIRLFVCIFTFGSFLYAYLLQQNEVTTYRLQIPKIAREVEQIFQENTRLRFDIETFENPVNLMKLAEAPEYSHLKHPLVKDIIVLPMPGSADEA
ncbi:MAG: hypothetical protein KDK55_02390 [Chlamydiia bacterium]|nr:hypothetical protein [Chlamydiia bacterium]